MRLGQQLAIIDAMSGLWDPQWRPRLKPQVLRQIDAAAKANQTAHAAAVDQGWKSAGPDAKALKALYAKQELRFFQADGNLTEDGKAVMALLGELDRHGLDKSGYRLTQLDLATRKVTEAFAARKTAVTAVAGDRAQAVAVAASGGRTAAPANCDRRSPPARTRSAAATARAEAVSGGRPS